ncbi:MAG: RNA-directed DNA polymerase [Rhodospirillales bacterium]|nr:RNA-directed DNA polymerase [Rhodospirillales bacterium]
MSYLEKLKNAKNRKDLARLLGFKPSALTAIIYMIPVEEKYTTFEIPKKSGGTRTIKAPAPKLKKLQTHLAHWLYECLAEIEEGRDSTPVAYGFRRKGTIAANAHNHKRRRYVLNLDLEDFFPSFNFGRVQGFFLKDKAFELNKEVATTIAQIACDGTALPQGSPCSPVISELIGQILDLRLLRFSKKHGVRYSRYADDITFSTNQKNFPVALAIQDSLDLSKWTLGEALINEIEQAGFKINANKTRMHCRGSRQMVTGLVVNEKVNIRSDYYRKARAMCDSLFQTGKYFKTLKVSDDPKEEPQPDFTSNLNPLEGILSHIYDITQKEDRRGVSEQRKEPRAIRALYRRFLFYKYCVAPKAPLIVTEGKTDPVYLREAIKYRDSFHPRLGKPGKNGFEFAVKFFNYGGQAHEVMDLGGGGSGNLKSIPLDYLRNLDATKKGRKAFKSKPMAYPVILVLDNDDGLRDIAGTLKTNFSISIKTNTSSDFYHITENLYLIKTPETSGQSCIEDMFPEKWKEKPLKGKKFNPNSKIDPQKEYGKEVFANSVVKPNANEIDFSGFDPLLSRIVSVLDDYKAAS